MALFKRDKKNIRFQSEEDSVEVFNKYKQSWEGYATTGLIVKPITVFVTTSTLGGKAVTCTVGDESHTTTFVSNTAVFNLFTEGTARIVCGDWDTTVTVESGLNYEITLDEKWGYITVNTTTLNGKTVTCKIGPETHTATFTNGVANFQVKTAGTATITCDGWGVTVNVVLGNSHTTNLNVQNATITVNTTTMNGQTVTCKIGSESYSAKFTNNSATFKVLTEGTVTISCSDSVKYVNVVRGGSYSCSLNEIVFWDGTTPQNGATYNATYMLLIKGNTNILNRDLVFKFASNQSGIRFICSTGATKYIKPDNTLSTDNTVQNWVTGVTYRIPASTLKDFLSGMASDDNFTLYCRNSANNMKQLTMLSTIKFVY